MLQMLPGAHCDAENFVKSPSPPVIGARDRQHDERHLRTSASATPLPPCCPRLALLGVAIVVAVASQRRRSQPSVKIVAADVLRPRLCCPLEPGAHCARLAGHAGWREVGSAYPRSATIVASPRRSFLLEKAGRC